MGRSRSRNRSRSRSITRRSSSRSRHRSSRRRSRDRSRDRDRDRSRDRDRKSHKSRRHRRRSYSRSSSPPSPRYDDSPQTSTAAKSPQTALGSLFASNGSQAVPMPDDVKKDLCAKDWDPNKMTGAALRWVTEQVAEQISARNKELDEVVRDRVAKAKIEMEVRLRAQIEQEWKEEMDAARKREQDSLNRVKAMEQSLADKLQEVENEKLKLNEERLKMLESKSKLEGEKNALQAELDQLKKSEQQTILNKGGFQRTPIRMTFGGK